MAKSTKNKDKLGTLDEFRAPWETATGDEAEIDKGKLKRFIFNLLGDKAQAQDARDDALEALEAAETERDEAKEQAANASPEEAQKQIKKLEQANADLTAKVQKFEADKAEAELRSEVLGDLDPKYAKYVTGSTKEELEKSLEQVKTDFNLGDGTDEDGDDDVNPLLSRPRSDLTNPLTVGGKGDDAPVDFEKAAAQIIGNRLI